MATFDTSQLNGSIDTLEIAHYCEWLPCEEELVDRGFSSKRGRFPGTKVWYFNGDESDYEPNLTIYPTWGPGRIRAGASLPKLAYGHNVGLLDAAGVYKALDTLGQRVTERLGIPFDVMTALVQRIDYAENLLLTPDEARNFFKHYSGFGIPHLTRKTLSSESEAIYFENQSRELVLYDKHGEVLRKQPKREDLHAMAEGIIRVEYRYRNEKTIKRYKPKFGIEEHIVAALVTPEQVNKATAEMFRLLKLRKLDLSASSGLRTIVDRLDGDLKAAISLYGFQHAVAELGKDFYRNPAFGYSKSTYDRNRRLLQQHGLPLSV